MVNKETKKALVEQVSAQIRALDFKADSPGEAKVSCFDLLQVCKAIRELTEALATLADIEARV